jgi:hypothetical protein
MTVPSGTSLNSQPAVLDGSYTPSGIGTMRKRLGVSDVGAGAQSGEILIGVLPANAIVLSTSYVQVTTAFNGTTPTLNVGVAGSPNIFASALAVTATGSQPFDDVALAAANESLTANRNLVATIGNAGGSTTTGSLDIVVVFATG